MNRQTVLFLGSKPIGYHCLNFLIKEKEKLQIDIIGLLSNDNPQFDSRLSLKKLATEHQIVFYNSLEKMPTADYIVSVQYHEILKANDIAKAKKLAFNLHMAPLPEYRGCNQFSFAILDGKKEFGTTIHKMDTRIDHGDILFETRFPIPANCWIHDLYTLTEKASKDLFDQNIHRLFLGNYEPIPQQQVEATRGSCIHYRHEMNNIKKIDLSWDSEKINRHIRATYMPGFEPPFTFINEKKVYFSTEWQKD